MRAFLKQLMVLMVIILAWNFALNHLSRNVPAKKSLIKARQPQPVTHLFLGNSLTASGIDEKAFATALPGSTPLNLALGHSMGTDHFLVAREFLSHSKPEVVFYGYFDFQLTESPECVWRDIMGNQALSLYLDPVTASGLFAPESKVDRMEILAMSRVPMVLERALLWGKVDGWRRKAEEWGMPKNEVNVFGRVSDFQGLQSKDEIAFDAKVATQINHGFSTPMRQLISLAREHKIRLILVEMPMSPEHRKKFYNRPAWKNYREHIQKLAKAGGVEVLVASDLISEAGKFADVLHLNELGAREFSTLVSKLIQIPQHEADPIIQNK
jgi:hypothetical protein